MYYELILVYGLCHALLCVYNLKRKTFSHVTFFFAYLFVACCIIVTRTTTGLILFRCLAIVYWFQFFYVVFNSKLCTRWPISIVIFIYLIFLAIPSGFQLSGKIYPNITSGFENSILIYSNPEGIEEPVPFEKGGMTSKLTQTSYIGQDVVFTCTLGSICNPYPVWVSIEGNRTYNITSELMNDTRESLKLKYNIISEILNDTIRFMDVKYDATSGILTGTKKSLKLKNNITCELLNDTIKFLNLTYNGSLWHCSLNRLAIRDIDEKDFKVYRCLNNISNTIVVQEFHLKKQEFETIDVYAAPGTLIFMPSYYTHLDNSEDITIYHTLNGKIITFDDCKCPYLLLYYYYSTRDIYGLWYLFKTLFHVYQFEILDGTENLLVSLTSWCMTPELYGLHSTVVVRRFQNTSGSLCSIKHVNQPLSLNIKYTESNLFENTERNSTYSILETDCWGLERESYSKPCAITKRLLYKDATLMYKTDRDYLFGLVVSVILFLIFLWYVYNICTGGIDMDTLAGISDRRNAQEKYNVFISCVQQDFQFVRKKILPILENKFGRKVFVPIRDVQPGSQILTDTGEAISQSASFIVVASPRYIKDRALNEFEINMILQNVNSRNLIIIRLDDCYIADIFNKKYQVLDLRNQHNRFQLLNILEKLPLYRSPLMKRVKMTLRFVNLWVGVFTTLVQIFVLFMYLLPNLIC